MTTYEMCKILIQKRKCEYESMIMNLDIFLLGGRITEEEYLELKYMLDEQTTTILI